MYSMSTISKDFVDYPYLHFPEIPPVSHKLAGLRRIWELNRKELTDVNLGRNDFMDLMCYLRRLDDNPSDETCPKRNLTKRWLQGWIESNPPFEGSALLKEASYLARCVFNWEAPVHDLLLEVLDDFDVEEETTEPVEEETTEPVEMESASPIKSWSVLNLTIKGAGEVFIGEVSNTPLSIEGDVKVHIKGAEGDKIYGLRVTSKDQ